MDADAEPAHSIVVGSRFDPDADDGAGAERYLHARAHQSLIDGFRVDGELERLVTAGEEWGVRAFVRAVDGTRYQTIYIYPRYRGRGLVSALLARRDYPVVTVRDCELEHYLTTRGVPFVVVARITETPEYAAVAAHYGARTAGRSDVPLMNHIDEGLAVLQGLHAGERAMRAYCLHPLVQADADLAATYPRLGELGAAPHVIALAFEYRNIANATLSSRVVASAADIPLSPIAEVNAMLVADKIQNRKDFILHHRASHPRRRELDWYFARWLERLAVDDVQFARWFEILQVAAVPIALDEALRRAPL